jgi:hypothetical protein
MTNNQDPLQALQTLIEDKENLSTTTAPTIPEVNQEQTGEQTPSEGQASVGGELTPEQLVAQQAASAAKEAELKAKIKEHKAKQAVKDQEALKSLRGELPQVSPKNPSEKGIQTDENQELAQEPGNSTTKKVVHNVKQLKRLD